MTPPPRLVQALDIFQMYGLRRSRQPLLASYKLTYRCNLTCAQCPFYPLGGKDPTLPQVIETLDKLRQRGSRFVIFEGGEPMLWKDGKHTVHTVIEQARQRFYCVGMTTNGTLPLDVPVDVLWVSLDGLAETHNHLRGGPIFERVIANIRQSHLPKIFAHITVNRVNAPEVPDLIRFLRGLVKGITVQFYYPYNRKDELFLEFEGREELLDEIIHLKRSGYPVLNSTAALQALKRNRWRCLDFLVDNANPDGRLAQGCYLRGRADIDCPRCGFSPHTEISLAYQGNPLAMLAGLQIFY